MAIEVTCDCGNVYTVGVELSGKKLRCKTCNVVLKVPVVPVADSKDDPVPPSEEYEVVKEDGAAPVVCPTCGAPGKPGDSVCLACGATIGAGGPALVPKPALFVAVGLVVAAVLGGVGYVLYRSVHLNSLISQGREQIERGDLARARASFDEVLRANKDSVEALDGMVQVGVHKPDWNLVKNYGDRLIAKLPPGQRRAQTYADVAHARLESNEWKGAEKAAREAQKEDSSISGMDEIIAISLAGAGENKDAAIEALKKADQAGSRDFRVAQYLAKLTEAANVHEARTWMDKAAGLTEKDPAIWLECARLREKDGDKEGALLALKRTADLDAQNPQAHVRLAQAYLDAKNASALEEAKLAKTLAADDPLVARTLGAALLEAGEPAAAKTELERADKLSPDDPVCTFLLGRALIRTGDAAGGIERLEKALRKNDKVPGNWLEAGKLALGDAKQPEKAATFLDRCLSFLTHPLPKEVPADQRAIFGEAAVLLVRALSTGEGARERNTKKIEDVLRDGMIVDPKRRELYVEAGTHQIDLNKNKEGLDLFERGLATVGDDPDLLYKAGDAGIKIATLEGYKAAVKHLEKLVAIKPDYPSAKDRLEIARRGVRENEQ